MHDPAQRPVVGIGVMIIRDGKVLLGKRKKNPGVGEFCYPGGHLENLESFEACAKRETFEEAGIEIENVRFLRVLNMTAYAPKHYVHIALVADWKSGEAKRMEPEKCEGWDWYPLDNLPSPVFATVRDDMIARETGKNYWDAV
jgi:8-oxo-dGTP diphosphatase